MKCTRAERGDERPVRFRLEGTQYWAEDMLDQWYEPDSIFYKVRASDGNFYILRPWVSLPDGAWDLISFREQKKDNA